MASWLPIEKLCPCGLRATCKDLGCRVLSDLELGLLDTMIDSSVCFLGDQVLLSFEICEFLCYSSKPRCLDRVIASAAPSIPALLY